MMRFSTLLLFALSIFSSTVSAEESKRLYAVGIPESGFVTLKSENYEIPIDAASGWTIEKMLFQDKEFSRKNGHYGTVMTPKGGKWWGTGHKEGGREVVNKLTLTVDGKKTPIKIGSTIQGKNIQLIKESIIWKFKVIAEVTVTNDYVLERTQLEALEDSELDPLYYFMHCFPPRTTKWISEIENGSIEEGELKSIGGMKINKNTRWVAQFDPENKLGILCYTPKIISGKRSASMIWDLEHYHKYYLRQNKGQAFKKGEKLDFTVIVKAVPYESGTWEATQNAVKQLKRSFPEID